MRPLSPPSACHIQEQPVQAIKVSTSIAIQEMASDFWTDSRGTQYPFRTDIHKFCPKGHKLLSRVAPMTQVPAFCNFCFKHIVQSAWAGDVKFCPVNTCHFIICASCLTILQETSEKIANPPTCEDNGAVSSLNVRFIIMSINYFSTLAVGMH